MIGLGPGPGQSFAKDIEARVEGEGGGEMGIKPGIPEAFPPVLAQGGLCPCRGILPYSIPLEFYRWLFAGEVWRTGGHESREERHDDRESNHGFVSVVPAVGAMAT